MTAQSVEGLGSARMSSNLLATLGRANDYARAQNHTKVTLEHVLLALSEDPDALVLLQTTNVDVTALKMDVSGHISRNEDRHAEGVPTELTISSEVGDIMKAASAAAQGRRPEINGAIVLAAIVGDGRSTAAHTLKSQGLTFDHAIKFLRSAPTPTVGEQAPTGDAGQSTEDILAEARDRIKTRADTNLVEGVETLPSQQSEPEPVSPPSPPTPRPEAVSGDDVREPKPFEAPPQLRKKAASTPPASAPAITEEQPTPPPVPASPPPAAASPSQQAGQGHAPSPPPPRPPQSTQQPPPGQGSLPSLEDVLQRERGVVGAKPVAPSGTFQQAPQQQSTPPQPPLPHPAGGHTPQPHAPAGGRFQHPQSLPPQRPDGQPLPPQAPPLQRQRPQQSAPPPGGALPPLSRPSAGAPPQSREAMQQRPSGAGNAQLIEAGQLVENIPRSMKVGVAMLVEARIAKSGVRVIAQGMQGNGQPQRHEVMITKAMSVRLRAPADGFTIETSSPETQWIENNLGALGDDFASWRWTITPKTSGAKQLQLIVSARTVGGDGLAAETVLPDQVIDVKVRTNYANVAKRWGSWVAAAVVGGLFARFGEGFFDLATKIVDRISSSGA
ncbi:MAG: Clp protease N-terminal domain-containing protein [Hyphomicrobiaceae bacterium]